MSMVGIFFPLNPVFLRDLSSSEVKVSGRGLEEGYAVFPLATNGPLLL